MTALGSGRGRGGRGRYQSAPEKPPTADTETEGKGPPSITLDNIVCWACGKKGHRSNKCPIEQVHFAGLAEDEIIYYSAVQSITSGDTVSHVLFSAATREDDTVILLDTQSGIHLLHSPALAIDIQDSLSPVTIQGITGNRVRIIEKATIKDIGIKGYYSPRMSANIISYSKLKEKHSVYYDEDTNSYVAAAFTGPKFTFHCVNGHYVMDMVESVPDYVINGPAKYSVRQLANSRHASEFIKRMGYVSYKGAAEIVERGYIDDIDFTRVDLVNAQNIYGTPAADQLGQGTQRTTKSREDDQIPLHESVAQELQVDLFVFLGNVPGADNGDPFRLRT